jgi:hypothetical protein
VDAEMEKGVAPFWPAKAAGFASKNRNSDYSTPFSLFSSLAQVWAAARWGG